MITDAFVQSLYQVKRARLDRQTRKGEMAVCIRAGGSDLAHTFLARIQQLHSLARCGPVRGPIYFTPFDAAGRQRTQRDHHNTQEKKTSKDATHVQPPNLHDESLISSTGLARASNPGKLRYC